MDPVRFVFARFASFWGSDRHRALRALFVLVHALAITSVACPAPAVSNLEGQLRKPAVRAELESWSGRLARLGLDVGPDRLREVALRVGRTWGDARSVALAPFVAYLEAIDARQGWYLFTAPDRMPQRFVLRATTGTGELPLFELGKPSESQVFDQAFLDQHRVRRALFQAAWSDRPVFDEVCSWFAREAAPRVSGLTRVTCQLVEEPVLSPADAGAPLRSPSRAPRVVRTLRVDPKGTRRK